MERNSCRRWQQTGNWEDENHEGISETVDGGGRKLRSGVAWGKHKVMLKVRTGTLKTKENDLRSRGCRGAVELSF